MKKKKRFDIEFEIDFFEKIIKKRPFFIEALSALGDLYTKQGLMQKGLEMDLTLSQLKADDPIVFYNLACSYSLVNNIDLAFISLKKAVDLGYEDFRFLKEDDDLKNLRVDDRFKEFINNIAHP